MLTPPELELARSLLTVLRSDKYKDRNYLFLVPFALNEVPGYLDVVAKPMDLQTVGNNLEAGSYDSMDAFLAELTMTFQNAIAYHGNRETKFIAKFARDMLKAVQKEKNKLENPQKKKISLKIGKQLPKAANVTSSAEALSQEVSLTEGATKKAPKIKLKIPPVKAKPTQIKLKLSANKVQSADLASVSSAQGSVDDKKKKTPKKKEPKLSVKISTSGAGANRGKELPRGVAASASTPGSVASAASASTKGSETAKQRKTKSKKTTMSQSLCRQCFKVILGLRRRQQKDIAWFLNPVAKTIMPDYKSKIKHPMDISRITAKLENGSYSSLSDFVLDVRRISANCLRYNTRLQDSIRHSAVRVLKTAEDLMSVFLTTSDCTPYPRLLYCWPLCVNVIDTLCNITNPSDGQPTILYFLHPVSVYCDGQFPAGYLDVVKKPMDFGTVVSHLLEGKYQSVTDFSKDCRTIIENARIYYGDKEDGKIFLEQANRLDQVLSSQLDQLARYDKSTKGQMDRQKALVSASPVIKPPIPFLLSILEELRAINYTDTATKITEPAMGPFEKPVPLAVYPDYLQHISEPMDLSQIEKRVKNDEYESPEAFDYDVTLTFRNCELYNSKRNGDHFVKMAKFATRSFRKIFYAKVTALEDRAAFPDVSESGEITDGSPNKKGKTDSGAVPKAVPRITLSSAALNAAARATQLSSRPSSTTSQKKTGRAPVSNQPLPLHIAISRVKEAFPLRRAVKNLQAMEADLAKYLKDLMRHPWLSAARPKFVFHVPVTMLYPTLREAYAAKTRKPMDLTTVECTLLAGNRYTSPQDFLQDIALTFSNAVRFNKDGRDIGDPASCAYYDASVHLLRYARWLSLEQLSNYIEDSDHVDENGPDGLPPFQWKLTSANLAKAREEQKKIVAEETIERSLEGDRWTWQEAECDKLLRALRHQSDNKYMKFFVHSDYPPNYTAYIAKPMDWDKVQKKLRKRQYERFSEIIADLRLIFENAKKYNSYFNDPISQAALAAAEHMSEKLESAINRLMLAVSDRVERERIDHANAEREEEAIERAEAAQIRANWEREHKGDGTAPPPPVRTEGLQRIRLRKAATRREDADFEIPFFDDENEGQHERSYFEVIKFQKSMFEKQRQEMSKMRSMAAIIGGAFHARALQRTLGEKWVEQERKKRGIVLKEDDRMDVDEKEADAKQDAASNEPSAVLDALQEKGRQQMKLTIAPVKKRANKKRPRLSFD